MKDFEITKGILERYNGNEPHVVIPNGVTCIGNSAFYGRTNVTSIEIPNSVIWISGCAFIGCENLTSIDIPNSVDYIGLNAFMRCSSLTKISIPNNVSYIDLWAFDGIRQVKPQYNGNGTLRAFKAFKKDWSCRGFKYEIGKTYHRDGIIHCCDNGFHACPNPLSVFNYYHGNLIDLRFAEVELNGKMDWDKDKVAASDIKIARELTVSELAKIYNSMEK